MKEDEDVIYEIGAEDTEIPIKTRVVEALEGKQEIRMEIGRPQVPILFLDGEAIDDFISKLGDMKNRLADVV